jgi:hypothetical protein
MGGLNPHWFLDPLAITGHHSEGITKFGLRSAQPYKNIEKFTQKAY